MNPSTSPSEAEPRFLRLFRRSAQALAAGAALAAFCFFFVDRPVARFVHDHALNQTPGLEQITFVPPIVQAWAPAALVLLALRRALGPLTPWQRALAAAAVAIIVADQFRESLSFVFARYWPATWRGNPSYLGDGTYGFVLFRDGKDYGSFPSGHMARTAAVVAACWLAWPSRGWRALGAAAIAAEAVALVGMNYHFVGDVAFGTILGGTVGAWCAAAFSCSCSERR